MTYSIVAIDLSKELLGVGVVSGSLAVGSRVPWAKAKVAAVATQAYTNPALGPLIIELVSKGLPIDKALKKALLIDGEPELRQVIAIDSEGNTATYSGEKIPREYEVLSFHGYACAGNLLKRRSVIHAVCEGFRNTKGSLPSKIINALRLGHNAGGDARGDRSAALLIVGNISKFGGYYDRLIDLRVDYSLTPLNDLTRLLELSSSRGL